MSILPRFVALIIFVACGSASTVWAQAPANNPYAGLESARGTWPVFYKPDPNDAKYAKMIADGICKPEGKTAQAFYRTKMVDVNALPDFSLEGKITEVAAGSVTVVDSRDGASYQVMVNENRAVSRVNVQGKGTKEMLSAGAFVRFVGKVNASGVAEEKIDQIELTSPGMSPQTPVKPNQTQNLAGKILRCEGEHLVVQAPTGSVRRLEVDLAPEAKISARVADHRMASVGDTVKMKGRILRMTAPMPTFCFADELDVEAAGIITPKKTK